MSAADEAKRTPWSRSWFPPTNEHALVLRSSSLSPLFEGKLARPLGHHHRHAPPPLPPPLGSLASGLCGRPRSRPPLTASLLLLFARSTTRPYDTPLLARSSTTQGVLHARRFPLLGTPSSRPSSSAPAQSRFRSPAERGAVLLDGKLGCRTPCPGSLPPTFLLLPTPTSHSTHPTPKRKPLASVRRGRREEPRQRGRVQLGLERELLDQHELGRGPEAAGWGRLGGVVVSISK
ncbi:hypothetical protein K438DRAFT_1960960 [Mycena galopus ATCC 62051]|nr:hypothetical protein K438DRAFT_1960960 [Mycena galopus ATCC 62051]